MNRDSYNGCDFNATRFNSGKKAWPRWRTDKQAAAEESAQAVRDGQRAGAEARRALADKKAEAKEKE